jgi:hypothetical protein
VQIKLELLVSFGAILRVQIKVGRMASPTHHQKVQRNLATHLAAAGFHLKVNS